MNYTFSDFHVLGLTFFRGQAYGWGHSVSKTLFLVLIAFSQNQLGLIVLLIIFSALLPYVKERSVVHSKNNDHEVHITFKSQDSGVRSGHNGILVLFATKMIK